MRVKCRPIAEGEIPRVSLTDEVGTEWAVLCGWFAGCPNDATGTTPHPALGDVPTCAGCAAFATPTTPTEVTP